MKKSLLLFVSILLSACTPSTFVDAPAYPIIIENDAEAEEIEAKLQVHSLPLDQIVLPEGFEISLFASGVDGARSMALSPEGTLFVGTRKTGKVYALKDLDQDGKADQFFTIASGLNSPNGVVIKDGSLYVAEISRIIRFDDIENNLSSPPRPVVIKDDLPTDAHHGWKFIRLGPENKIYIPVGAPCNICESAPIYSALHRMNLDGTDFEMVAAGIRNTVGFDWHPDTDQLWFTENGADWLGDDQPADELNRVSELGEHFGFPVCHAGYLLDENYARGRECEEFTAPEQLLGPHVAALGMRFYTGEQFPTEYDQQIFIAEHGSWNRSEKTGYRISLVRLEDGKAISYEPFAEGWLQGQSAWGRPVDVEVMPDGSLLVSDDAAEAIYLIRYKK